MKRILLLTSFVMSLTFSAMATHIMGGEIIAEHNGNNNYRILLTMYRDTVGINTDSTQTFDIWQNGSIITSITTQMDPNANHPIFGFQQGTLLPYFPYGVEMYFFSDTITLPGPGEYTISWDNCCRNGAIQNLPNPLSVDMRLFTTVTVDPNQGNSTPYFMVKPVIYLPVNTPWQYSPLPYDVDGDSLNWYLAAPHESSNSSALGDTINGYTDPPSDPSGMISIDPVTGTISWTASMLGNWVYTVVCEEYRNGVKIGEIRRDMQFIVLPNGNLPRFTNIGHIPTPNGYPEWKVVAGQNQHLTILAGDDDANDVVRFRAYGKPFLLSNPPVCYQHATGVGNEIKAILQWAPTTNEVSADPYLVVLRLMDGTYMNDEAIFIRVVQNSEIEEFEEPSLDVFPNPSDGRINIPVNLFEAGDLTFKIYDLAGKEVYNKTSHFDAGNHLVVIPSELNSGQYILSVDQNDIHLGDQQIIIVK